MRICCFYAKIRSSEKFQTTFDSRKSLTGGISRAWWFAFGYPCDIQTYISDDFEC